MSEPPEYNSEIAAQAPLMAAAWAFAQAFWIDRDFHATWLHTHPLLRRCWAQTWLHPLQERLRADGFVPDEVVEVFVQEEPDHVLWEHFVHTQLQAPAVPVDPNTWGTKVNPEITAVDTELVSLMPVPAGGYIQPGESYVRVPLLMRFSQEAGWQVLNFTSEMIPEPGWPPVLSPPQ